MSELNNAIRDFVPACECVASHFVSTSELYQCYITHDALAVVILATALFAVYSLVWSIIGNNCSKVDQIWSITPWLYTWILYHHNHVNHGNHPRLLLVVSLLTLWGIRLTFNFARRGGYGNFIVHEEDYRWPILRAKMHPIVFLIFNITFIASYQNVLLMLISMPAHSVMMGSKEILLTDIGLSAVFVICLVMETLADQQQWNFQNIKYSLTADQRKKHASKEIRDGFIQSGLFAISRHPAYFAEQMIWVCTYLFSISSSGKLVNIYGLGAFLLVLLFQGSMWFSESITLSKYPEYKSYQNRVTQCIPWFPAAARKQE